MKNPLSLFIGILIVMVLVVYMFLFQVHYDEVAVLTTFGGASGDDIKPSRKWPYFRWPWPVQGVTRYPTRLTLLEDQLEEQQTRDGYAVIINTYVAWRIKDPLVFFRQYKDVARAEQQLTSHVRNKRGIISQYAFVQLVNNDPEQLKLGQIEQEIERALQKEFDDQGISIEQFGIERILLPETVTEDVFEQMRETRKRLAANIRGSGEADAKDITSRAESIRSRILAFAKNYAKSIEAKGDEEAQRYFQVFSQDEDFAIFLRWLESTKTMFEGGKTTIIMDQDQLMTPPGNLPVAGGGPARFPGVIAEKN